MRTKDQLRDYQQRTIHTLYERDGVELVMPMGAGKTASALTAVSELLADEEIRHALVLAPKRVINLVWPDEIANWDHLRRLRYELLNSGPEPRLKQLHSAPGRDLTLIGLDHTQWLCEQLERLPAQHPLFDVLIIDEISRFKNPASKRAKALLKLINRFRLVWALTGTPRPNGEQDLFKPLAIVSRNQIWGKSFYKWRLERFIQTDFQGHSWMIREEWRDRTLAEAAQWMLSLAPEDMPTLPPVNVIEHRVWLDEDARALYDQMEKELFVALGRRDVLAISSAVATGKCAQIVAGFLYGETNKEVTRIHSTKIDWLEDLVTDLSGDPLIVVYEFVEDLAQLRKLFGDDLPYLGQGVSDSQAAENVRRWNARELPILALHPASAAHGINLQAGGHQMAWLSPCWSAELWDQAVARIARPGQSSPVFIHVCLAEETIDEAKRLRVISKLSAQEAFTRYRLGKI
jgi:hypothetical protein